MSQVIVTEDQLQEKRARSGRQEKAIEREAGFNQWRKNDVTHSDSFQRMIGLLTYPVLLLWAVLGGLIYFVVQACRFVFGLLGGRASKPK